MTPPADPARHNGELVRTLRRGLVYGFRSHATVPNTLLNVLRSRAWTGWTDTVGRRREFHDSAFVAFVTSPLPHGLGVSLEELRHYLPAGSPERLELEREVAAGTGEPVAEVPTEPLSLEPRVAAEQIRRAYRGARLSFLARLVAEAAGFVLAKPPAAE